ncbi:chromate resistance protein ChrB domain-containing protein [Sphingomonas sp. LaA6.9]|uniref:chromate resistance protein ChrB domain-containing protein n=1 Tax=Sphingomonas sp. LaA6.9 TaxID=2919914 RepID=UPI001F4F65A2|nr:chromate resistance protein ChrB domain-containing protein [Sphingomonas sp. LaA6.9]MCJ8159379.1 chromate resistance protein [Sphingomonas sp. LaA6.9]
MERSSHITSVLDTLFDDRRPSKWVTRERPKIDRIACPWLIRRFVDADAQFLYVPTPEVFEVAAREGAVAYDIPGAEFSHVGELCSFDAFLERFALDDAGLAAVAPIIRGADTDRHDLAPEAAGLHALALGMAASIEDDHALLERGCLLYDALYAWAVHARGERHSWTPPRA